MQDLRCRLPHPVGQPGQGRFGVQFRGAAATVQTLDLVEACQAPPGGRAQAFVALGGLVGGAGEGVGAAHGIHHRRKHSAHGVQKGRHGVDGPVDDGQHVGADGREGCLPGGLEPSQAQTQIGQLPGVFFRVAGQIGQALDGLGVIRRLVGVLDLLGQLPVGLQHFLKTILQGLPLRIDNDLNMRIFCHIFLLSSALQENGLPRRSPSSAPA